jgi:isopropylmalate/homocitrate/citramalate synthase
MYHDEPRGVDARSNRAPMETAMPTKASKTPWHTDRWFTSPWNHDPDVRGQLAFPPQVKIHDATLRDGEQQAGVVFTKDDKVRIAEALAEAGVHRIEAGLPAVSPADDAAIREIVRRDLPSEIYAFSRCIIDDVKRAVDCGVAGVALEIPSSRHLIELGYRWTVERAVGASVEATAYAHEQGLKVSFFPIDATRASVDDYLDLVGSVARDGHLDALVLVDTFGTLTPQAVGRFVAASRDRFHVPLETHFHMDYGMGVANSIIAAANGADTIHVTVGGIGERAGNAPLEETVLALKTLYDLDIGLQTERLTSLHRLVMELSGVSQPSNRPVTGTRLFDVESGIISTWIRNVRDVDLTESFPYVPALVGQSEVSLVLGKGSGLDSIVDALERVGMTATPEETAEILAEVKGVSLERKSLIGLEEFETIARRVVERVPATTT